MPVEFENIPRHDDKPIWNTGERYGEKQQIALMEQLDKVMESPDLIKEFEPEALNRKLAAIKMQQPGSDYDAEMVKRDIQYREMDRLFKQVLEQSDKRYDWDDLERLEEIEQLLNKKGIETPEQLRKDKEKAQIERVAAETLSHDMFKDSKLMDSIDRIKKDKIITPQDAQVLNEFANREGVKKAMNAIHIQKQAGLIDNDSARLISDVFAKMVK